jgi:predicted nucleic acid-binding protein
MTKVLLDTNVILDVLLDRQPHVEASGAVWAIVETGRLPGMISAHAVTTLHYLIRKELGLAKAKRIMGEILNVFAVAAVDGTVIRDALTMPSADFEDSVTAAAAKNAACYCIVTRDPKGFRGSSVLCLTPEAALPILAARSR